jgi:tRNA (Thr-GGU) A37 N-methylase
VTPLLGREGSSLNVGDIEAFDGTPVIDIKGYFPESDSVPQARIPDWNYHRDPPV